MVVKQSWLLENRGLNNILKATLLEKATSVAPSSGTNCKLGKASTLYIHIEILTLPFSAICAMDEAISG
jgi:hypothetical protein